MEVEWKVVVCQHGELAQYLKELTKENWFVQQILIPASGSVEYSIVAYRMPEPSGPQEESLSI